MEAINDISFTKQAYGNLPYSVKKTQAGRCGGKNQRRFVLRGTLVCERQGSLEVVGLDALVLPAARLNNSHPKFENSLDLFENAPGAPCNVPVMSLYVAENEVCPVKKERPLIAS